MIWSDRAGCWTPTEKKIFNDNLLVRIHLIIKMSRPALRHERLNSLFQVALYLPFLDAHKSLRVLLPARHPFSSLT